MYTEFQSSLMMIWTMYPYVEEIGLLFYWESPESCCPFLAIMYHPCKSLGGIYAKNRATSFNMWSL